MPSAAAGPEFDGDMMAIALRMARRGLGATAPNPSVGAVIVDEAQGGVIARATTAPGGRPHAEAIALERAGPRARDATIYVTLEPCAHQGRMGPCADAIVAAGIRRVVVAIEDPDPRVSGRGLERMRAAGLEVVGGIEVEEARWVARGHILRVTERRPFVTLKLALDASGKIARGTGRAPVWVSGVMSRAHAMLLRAETDAILIGSHTAHDDDPELTCRLPGLFDRSPVRVVLTRSLDIALDSKLVASAKQTPLWLMTSAASDPARRAALAAKDAVVIDTEEADGRLSLQGAMRELAARGITRLLVEGGPVIWRTFSAAALFDEVVLYMSGRQVERYARAAIGNYIGEACLVLSENRQLETDTMWRFVRVFPRQGA